MDFNHRPSDYESDTLSAAPLCYINIYFKKNIS